MVSAVVLNPLPSAPIAISAGAVYGHTLTAGRCARRLRKSWPADDSIEFPE